MEVLGKHAGYCGWNVRARWEKKPSESKGRAPLGVLPETCSTFSLIKKCLCVLSVWYNFMFLNARKIRRGPCGCVSGVQKSTREEMICGLKPSSKAASPGSQEFWFSVKKKKYSKIGLRISGDESKVMSPDSCSVPRAPTAASSETGGGGLGDCWGLRGERMQKAGGEKPHWGGDPWGRGWQGDCVSPGEIPRLPVLYQHVAVWVFTQQTLRLFNESTPFKQSLSHFVKNCFSNLEDRTECYGVMIFELGSFTVIYAS